MTAVLALTTSQHFAQDIAGARGALADLWGALVEELRDNQALGALIDTPSMGGTDGAATSQAHSHYLRGNLTLPGGHQLRMQLTLILNDEGHLRGLFELENSAVVLAQALRPTPVTLVRCEWLNVGSRGGSRSAAGWPALSVWTNLRKRYLSDVRNQAPELAQLVSETLAP